MWGSEYYDVGANTFYPAELTPESVPCTGHTAFFSPVGHRMLLAGRNVFNGRSIARASCLIYYEGMFFTNLSTGRESHSTSELADGTLLIAGGLNDTMHPGDLQLSELLSFVHEATRGHRHPVTVRRGPDLNTGRSGHTATVLLDGRILLCGGRVTLINDAQWKTSATNTAEVYDRTWRFVNILPRSFRRR